VATPEQGVVISTAQMYTEVRDLAKTVSRIEAKIDGVLNETRDIRADLADHETRLRALESMPKSSELEPRIASLERSRWPLPSIGALTGVAGAVMGAIGFIAR
jgi:septal ring factor EnvC (AmiA/AmiB activator)